MRKSVLTAGLAAVLALGIGSTIAQDAAVPGPDRVALTSTEDALAARRLLMDSIGSNNDVLHEMLDGWLEWDTAEFRGRLNSMSAMMAAFPGMFRAEPNPWTEESEVADPAGASLALPSVWENWDDFLAMSQEASDTMFRASLASREDALAVVEELEGQCEACHAMFRKAEEMATLEQYLDQATPAATQ